MIHAFINGNTTELPNQVEVMKRTCPDVTAMVSFSENHDLQRIANMTDDMSVRATASYVNAHNAPSLTEVLPI
jgi:alpha-amylase